MTLGVGGWGLLWVCGFTAEALVFDIASDWGWVLSWDHLRDAASS